MPLENSKPWYKSLGEWGALLCPIFGLLLPILGKADLAAFVTAESAGIVEWLSMVGVVITSAMAFIGRYRAKTTIKPIV